MNFDGGNWCLPYRKQTKKKGIEMGDSDQVVCFVDYGMRIYCPQKKKEFEGEADKIGSSPVSDNGKGKTSFGYFSHKRGEPYSGMKP